MNFRNDPVLAVVFGGIALIGALPRPWLAVLLVMPLGIVYAVPAATIISILVYRRLARQRYMAPLLARLRRTRWSRVVAGCLLIAALLAGIGYARVIDFPALNQHVPDILAYDTATSGIRQNRSYCLTDLSTRNGYGRRVSLPCR